MRRVHCVLLVLSLVLASMNVLAGNIDMGEVVPDDLTQNSPPADELAPRGQSPPLPSTIRLWEAWAKGYATVTQLDNAVYEVNNNGPVSIIIDEYIMLMSPSPSNPSEDVPGIDDETQDGVLIPTYSISSGSSLTYNYGEYVAYGILSPPPWWCTEDSEYTNANIPITLGGEIFPYDMIPIIQNYNYYTQDDVWAYMRDNPTLVIGKLPLWEEIANIGDEVDITLDVTNIGFHDAQNVVVTDTILPDYSYDPNSFTHTPSSIANNVDGSITLTWDIPVMDAAVETPQDEPTDYTTVYIGYKLITPVLDPDIRIFLPRAYVLNGNNVDAESEEPLLETYFVNRPPEAIVENMTVLEGESFTLDGSASYDPDEIFGDYIASYEWDTDMDGHPDAFGPQVDMVYGDNGVYIVGLTVIDSYGASDTAYSVVTVNNVAPTLNPLGTYDVDENQAISFEGVASDPGSDDLIFTWDWGDGTSTTNIYYNNGVSPDPYPSPSGVYPFLVTDSVSHVYGDNGNFTVILTVVDDDGGEDEETTTATVWNVAPTIEPLGNYVTDENTALSVIGTATDPGSDDLTFYWDWGDGTSTTTIYYNNGVSPDPYPSPEVNPMNITDIVTHTYGDDGVFTVILEVEDDDGAIDTKTTTITVLNVDPTIDLAPTNTTIENQEVILTATATDPGSDDLKFSWDWGDGTYSNNTYYNNGISPDPYPSPEINPINVTDTVTYTYGDNGVFTVILTVEDDDNGIEVMTIAIDVFNEAPRIEPLANYTADENDAISVTGTASDPGSDDLTFTWDWDDGTPNDVTTYYNDGLGPDPYPSPDINPINITDSVAHIYGDNGVFMVTLTVEDDDGGIDVKTTTVYISNIAPTIEQISNGTAFENQEVTLQATASDPGSDDLIFTWDWGDGTVTTTTYYNNGISPDPYPSPDINPITVTNLVTHIYGDNGVFIVTLTVEDDDGGISTAITTVIVYNVAPAIEEYNYNIYQVEPRTHGYWKHQCNIEEPKGDHVGIQQEFIDAISQQSQVFSGISTKDEVEAYLTYKGNDMREKAKLQLIALWLNVVSGMLPPQTEIDLPQLTTSKTVQEAIDEIEHIILTSNDKDELERVKDIADMLNNHQGLPDAFIVATATASDPGSDDLTFSWNFGNGKYQNTTYYNDGISPDPYPSPEINPIDITDTAYCSFWSTGSITVILTVTDDDGGEVSVTFEIVI